MKLGTVKELKERLNARWSRGYFLKADNRNSEIFPLLENLKGPKAGEIAERYNEVLEWIEVLKKEALKANLQIEWKEINHRLYGRNRIPRGVRFARPEDLAGFLGKKKELEDFRRARATLAAAFPDLEEWCSLRPFELLRCGEALKRLIAVTDWLLRNPRPEIYLRRLTLPGVDTKFVERHRGILSEWLDILLPREYIDGNFKGIGCFEKRYGFLSRPELVRVRFLDSPPPPCFPDISIPSDDFARWKPHVKRIFVVENDVTALTFPKVADSLLIFGRGYGFTVLAEARWLGEKEIYYWGDLDTHGFAILSQFRSLFPRTESFLMDRQTLMKNKTHWGRENRQRAADLSGLTTDEQLVYDELRFNRIQKNLRLEQELIDFTDLENFLRRRFDSTD